MTKTNARPKQPFFITASEDIGDKIKQGDDVLIDPRVAPTPGRWVLINGDGVGLGQVLMLWKGPDCGGKAAQMHIIGVAVKVQRTLDPVPASWLKLVVDNTES